MFFLVATSIPMVYAATQRLLDELEVCIAAAGVGGGASAPATPYAGRRRGHTAAGAAAAAQPVQLAAGAAGDGAPRTLLSDNDYKPVGGARKRLLFLTRFVQYCTHGTPNLETFVNH